MRRAALVLTAALALVGGLAACGDDEGDTQAGDGTTTTTAGDTAASTTAGDTATSGGDTTTTGPTGTPTTAGSEDLPGEPLDLFPYEGATLAVVGVAAGDTLNVRSGPGTDFDVVHEAGWADDLTATGANRQLDDGSVWAEVEVEVDVATGWVNVAFVSEPGTSQDITEQLADAEAATLEELADLVVASRTFEGEGPSPTVTVVATEGNEIVIDVLGLADDAQEGERILLNGIRDVEEAETVDEAPLVVNRAEVTPLCSRGVSAEGLCT